MLDNYYNKILNNKEIEELFVEFERVWDKSEYYWYPLSKTSRTEVIAFPYDVYESKFGIKELKKLLDENEEIYEILENKIAGYVVKWESFEPEYTGFDCCHEGYWFSKTYKWAIYCSHENTITFAGSNLIQKIKEAWNDWEQYVIE